MLIFKLYLPPRSRSILLDRFANTSLKFYGLLLFLLAGLAFSIPAAGAQEVTVPNHFDPRERLTLPDLSGYERVRFLTTTDFPPFNFLDRNGRLSGFHIDLARAICETLRIEDRCQIQALPWDELQPALEAGEGEAIIAGLAVTDENRQDYRFTRTFLKLPARFVERRGDAEPDRNAAEALAGKRVGVIGGSAHEAMLRSFFPDIRPVTFTEPEAMFEALREESVEAVFGDGVELSFWLASENAENCCRFLDGPFFSDHFLGLGLAIAVAPEDAVLADAFDYALLALNNSGRFAEIYLRYFPQGLY